MVDQACHFGDYRAIRRFAQGESRESFRGFQRDTCARSHATNEKRLPEPRNRSRSRDTTLDGERRHRDGIYRWISIRSALAYRSAYVQACVRSTHKKIHRA